MTVGFEEMQKLQELYTLTEEQAWVLLDTVHNYFADNQYINGRHFSEIAAESMVREGMPNLAAELIRIHNALQAFHKGNFDEISYFPDTDAIEDFVNLSAGTKFAQTGENLNNSLSGIERGFPEVEGRLEIDWGKSSAILAEVKRKNYPEDLIMVEKLTAASQHTQPGAIVPVLI